jgi:hypothetical protein
VREIRKGNVKEIVKRTEKWLFNVNDRGRWRERRRNNVIVTG